VKRGFTLIELMVALVLGGLVVLLAHRTFGVAAELGGRVAAGRQAHDRAMNARRFLAAAFGSLEVGTVRNTGFLGLEDEVAFTTWLVDENGASLRKQVTVRLERSADDTGPVASSEAGTMRLLALVGPVEGENALPRDTLVLAPEVAGLAFDYLLDFGADAAWVREWRSPVSAPLAVRLRVVGASGDVDTLLCVIGPRG
jgi:prepilin-type N-terminal cleavage/methylation domain-containing protein